MGMGEPLANPAIFDVLRDLTDQSLFALRQRRITLSTVGVIPGIRRMTREFPQVNLAFSLHTPFDRQRSALRRLTAPMLRPFTDACAATVSA